MAIVAAQNVLVIIIKFNNYAVIYMCSVINVSEYYADLTSYCNFILCLIQIMQL